MAFALAGEVIMFSNVGVLLLCKMNYTRNPQCGQANIFSTDRAKSRISNVPPYGAKIMNRVYKGSQPCNVFGTSMLQAEETRHANSGKKEGTRAKAWNVHVWYELFNVYYYTQCATKILTQKWVHSETDIKVFHQKVWAIT